MRPPELATVSFGDAKCAIRKESHIPRSQHAHSEREDCTFLFPATPVVNRAVASVGSPLLPSVGKNKLWEGRSALHTNYIKS